MHQQGQIFQRLKEEEKIIKMISEFGLSTSTFSFKISIAKLVDKYSIVKTSSLSLHFLKSHLKLIEEICIKNASEYK